MEIKTITRHTIETHEAIENLLSVMRQAKEDKRFHLSLADSREFRDLCDDMEKMLDECWTVSIQIPLDLPIRGEMQSAKIRIN